MNFSPRVEYSEGALLFDSSLPVDDGHAQVNMGLLAYVRTLGIAGRSAKAGMLLANAELSANDYVIGQYRTRNTAGIADPAILFTVKLLGAPALSLREFKDYRQSTIVGFTFKLTAPWGVYEDDKLLNIGPNRWSLEPEFRILQAIRRWRLEAAAAVTFYTDNHDFDNGKTRRQEPIYSLQGYAVYSFRNTIWAAISTTYYIGGQTTIEGEAKKNDLQKNWRDVVDNSEFLNDLHAWVWLQEIPYYLAFSYKPGKDDDGVVGLNSQLPLKLQSEATRMFGFNNTHVGTVHDEAFIALFNEMLANGENGGSFAEYVLKANQ